MKKATANGKKKNTAIVLLEESTSSFSADNHQPNEQQSKQSKNESSVQKANLLRKLFRRRSNATKTTATNTAVSMTVKNKKQKKKVRSEIGGGRLFTRRASSNAGFAVGTTSDRHDRDDNDHNCDLYHNDSLILSSISSNTKSSAESSSSLSYPAVRPRRNQPTTRESNVIGGSGGVIETSIDLHTLLSDMTHLQRMQEEDCDIIEDGSYTSSDDDVDLSSGSSCTSGGSGGSGGSGEELELNDDISLDAISKTSKDSQSTNSSHHTTVRENFQVVYQYITSSLPWIKEKNENQLERGIQDLRHKSMMDDSSTVASSTSHDAFHGPSSCQNNLLTTQMLLKKHKDENKKSNSSIVSKFSDCFKDEEKEKKEKKENVTKATTTLRTMTTTDTSSMPVKECTSFSKSMFSYLDNICT